MARKGKVECKLVPDVPGTHEASKMYIELQDIVKNRPLGNFIYASYLQPGVADRMDALGYSRNKQGQHRARDIYKFFDVGKMTGALTIGAQSKSLGFTDKTGNLVDFDAVDAYTKAQDFNNTNKGRIAHVVQHGDKFNILIEDKDSRTLADQVAVNESLVMWDKLSEELTARGIDINDLNAINPPLVNPGSIRDFIKNLSIYTYSPNDGFSVRDTEMLLALNSSLPIVKNIMSRGWGSRAEVAQKMYDTLHTSGAAASTVALVNNVLDTTKKLPGFNLSGLRNAVNVAANDFYKANEEANIVETLKQLDKRYGIESQVLQRQTTEIDKYTDAVIEAVFSLQRQIRILEDKYGKTPQSEELSKLKEQLLEELKSKKNTSGLSEFLSTASKQLTKINTLLSSAPLTGTGLEYAHSLAAITAKATNFLNAYGEVVNALAIKNLDVDFSIDAADRDSLRDVAKGLKNSFDAVKNKVVELQKEAMFHVGKNFIGEHNSLYGKDLSDVINMLEADTTMTDYLYSIGRSSSTVIGMLGAIIRDAQNSRDFKLMGIAKQIERATHLLTKDGRDSSYIYDEKGRIVSPYDWDAYFKEKRKYMSELYRRGFKKNTLSFAIEMQNWEEANTTEVVVDKTTGRTERMPNFLLSRDFREGWTAAQNEYYDRMMDLKGQIGTLLPNYAQHQYIAPQKRTSWDQVLKEALRGERDFSSTARWFLENSKFWKMKEADTRFRSSGINVEDEEVLPSLSDYDNTVLKQIPLFYVKKIDAGNLSHDFSSALQSLASTALNYEAMESVRDIAEMMSDYVSRTAPVERDSYGKPKVDATRTQGINVVSKLRKVAQDSNTSTMIESYVAKHIYGIENNSEGLGAVICANLIGVTSLRGLAVNVKGAITNKFIGIIQSIIRAGGGQFFGFKDLAKAFTILLGEQGAPTEGLLIGGAIGGLAGAGIGLGVGAAIGAVGMTGKLIDILTGNKESKDTLIAEFFDTSQETYANLSDKRYHHTMFGRLFGSFSPTSMYSRGEYFIHMLNTYAVLLHENVVEYDPKTKERKVISLYDALKKGKTVEGRAELDIKNNITTINGIKISGLSDAYFEAIKRRIRYINQQCHGAMNKEDKGLIHQWILGKLAMNFRQWMVEHYSSRYRKLHWDESIRDVNMSNFYNNTRVLLNGKKVRLLDALEMVDNGTGDGSFHYEIKAGATTTSGTTLTDEVLNGMLEAYAEDAGWRRGFKAEALKVLVNYLKERRDYETSAAAYWDTLSETQKADVKQVLTESFMLLALASLSFGMGDPDDHKGEFFYRLWMYTIRRCLFDEIATTVPGMILEGKTMLNSPIAGTKTLSAYLYPLFGIGDVTKTIQSGRYKGWNKYVRNVLKYTVPFYAQIDQLLNLDEESGIFNVFENQITKN